MLLLYIHYSQIVKRLGFAVRVGGNDSTAGRKVLGRTSHDAEGVHFAGDGEAIVCKSLGRGQLDSNADDVFGRF